MSKRGYMVNANFCGGKPCINGTRFTVAQLIRQISSSPGISLDEICLDFDLRSRDVSLALQQIAKDYDVSFHDKTDKSK